MSKKTKFKVGDRVRSLVGAGGTYVAWHAGREGTVRAVDADRVGVEFDGLPSGEGHKLYMDMGPLLASNSGYWFYNERIAESGESLTNIEKITPPKKTTIHAPQDYRGNGKHKWERVADDTKRLRVPGGWLYGDDRGYVMVFVPLPAVDKRPI